MFAGAERTLAPLHRSGACASARTGRGCGHRASPWPAPRSAVEELQAITGGDGGFVLGNVPPGRAELRGSSHRATRRLDEVLELLPGLDRSDPCRPGAAAGSARQPHVDGRAWRTTPGAVAIAGRRSRAPRRRPRPRAGRLGGRRRPARRHRARRAPGAWQRTRRGAGAGGRLPRERSAHRPGRPEPDLQPRGRGGHAAARRTDRPRRQSRDRRACSWSRPAATSIPRARPGAAAMARSGARLGGSLGALTGSASAERQPAGFAYTVPAVRGGGEADRRNAGGDQWGAALTLDGPVERRAPGHGRRTAVSLGRPRIRHPRRTPRIGRYCWARARRAGSPRPRRSSGSRRAPPTRRPRPARRTTRIPMASAPRRRSATGSR